MITNPVLSNYIVIPVLALILILLIITVLRRSDRVWHKVLSVVRLTLILGMVFLLNLRPSLKRYNAEIELKNIDVLFVVDTTISMWAEDYGTNQTRMDGVQTTCDYIMQELAGSNFALIRFDNRAQILAPFTQDARSVSDAFSTIKQPDTYYARGSNLNVPLKEMQDLLVSSSKKEERKTVVFYISDGEITDGSKLESYAELEQYVDGGAVLCFGTKEGGKMQADNGYSKKYIQDKEKNQDAVSVIDEENLQKIAKDLQVEYLNVKDSSEVGYMMDAIKSGSSIRMEEAEMITYEDITFYLGAALAALLIWELIGLVLQRRL
ncbi:MAG: VWA domain-containing protein [Eubacterium sp.]|jgi:Ca-activated chloride channel family protein|nr:VWA domain-containing protein [Eubacterium sp.]